MDFGRVDSTDGIDLSAPPVDPRVAGLLGARGGGGLRVYTGAPLWAERSWVGGFYPPGTPPGGFLAAYARQLGAIEHNGTFHAIPSPAQTAAWAAQLPAGFRFCAKAPRAITHAADWQGAVGPFRAAMEPLRPFLGPVFFQFPPEIGPDDLDGVRARVEALAGLPRAVELRHPGWFHRRRLIGRAWGWLSEEGHTAVITDTPGHREVCHGSLTSPVLFLRLLALGLPSDAGRLVAWAAEIERLRALGLQEAYVFAHLPGFTGVPALLLQLHAALGSQLGIALPQAWEAGPQLRLLG